MLKIALGCDHAGFPLREKVEDYLLSHGYEVLDFGTNSVDPVDYPDFILPAAKSVAEGNADLGIVFGGSGNGEAIAANKVRGIRCALCWNVESAELSKRHNDANMISLGARLVSGEVAIAIVAAWLSASYEGGRHDARLEKIKRYEEEQLRHMCDWLKTH